MTKLKAVPPAANDSKEPTAPEFTKEFSDSLKGLGALSTINDLLQNGTFTYKYRFALDQSISFIQSLHAQSMEQALKDPQSDLVPELVALKDARKKQALEAEKIKKAEEKKTRKAAKVKQCPKK